MDRHTNKGGRPVTTGRGSNATGYYQPKTDGGFQRHPIPAGLPPLVRILFEQMARFRISDVRMARRTGVSSVKIARTRAGSSISIKDLSKLYDGLDMELIPVPKVDKIWKDYDVGQRETDQGSPEATGVQGSDHGEGEDGQPPELPERGVVRRRRA